MFRSRFSFIFGALAFFQGSSSMTLREEMYLTDDQQVAFDKFKAAALPIITTPYMKSDIVLMKYFRSCDMNENKTLEHLKDNLKWRLDLGFEALSEDEITEHTRLYPVSTFKDRLGRGVFFVPGRYWDTAKAASTPELAKKMTRFAFHIVEEAYIKGVSNSTGKTESGFVVIGDNHDVEMAKGWCGPCVQLMKSIAVEVDDRWPGGFPVAYIVNSPSFLPPLEKLITFSATKKVKDSILVFDENDAIWLPEILKFTSLDKLPELFVPSQQTRAGVPAGFSLFAAAPVAQGGGK